MTALPNRRSVRLPNYDYTTPGGYFLTICARDRQPLFATPVTTQIVSAAWADIPNHHPHVGTDEFIVMPNHVHGVLFLGELEPERARAQRVAPLQQRSTRADVAEPARAQRVAPLQQRSTRADVAEPAQAQRVAPLQQPDSLGMIVRAFKARVTCDLRAELGADLVVWQRNYYEHVIRDERALQRIRQYIIDNPARWAFDDENPAGQPDRVEREFTNWLKSMRAPVTESVGTRP